MEASISQFLAVFGLIAGSVGGIRLGATRGRDRLGRLGVGLWLGCVAALVVLVGMGVLPTPTAAMDKPTIWGATVAAMIAAGLLSGFALGRLRERR